MIEPQVMEWVEAGRRDEALHLILQHFRRKVFGLAFSILRNREAAEDVAQEVFLKIWKALPRFDQRAGLSTWIYAIARNTSLSALRARRQALSLEDLNRTDQGSDTLTVEPDYAQADQAALLRLIEQLPDKQRQVVILFYMHEQSHEEVAGMLNMPIGTVKTLLHRARACLSAAAQGAALEKTS